MTYSDNRKQQLNVTKVIENVINEFDRRRKSYLSCFIYWYVLPGTSLLLMYCFEKVISRIVEAAEQCMKSVESTPNHQNIINIVNR